MTRRDSALHASCAGGVVDLTAFEEDARRGQAHAVTLTYRADTMRVLHGQYRGELVWETATALARKLLEQYSHVLVEEVTVRPWQRCWRPTRAKRITPSGLIAQVDRA